MAADAPPPAVPVAQEVVLARREASEVVAAQDLPLTLGKAGRREEALVRRALFVTASVTLVRPIVPAPDTPPPASYRWTHQAYLQRQVCFTSITGLFACTAPTVEPLPDKAAGAAPAGETEDSYPLADADQRRLADQLRQRSAAVFTADRRANIDPLFRAAAVAVTAGR